MKRNILIAMAGLLIGLWQGAALAAALNFSITGSYPADVTMGDPTGTALTYTITNTSTGTTARISQLTITAPTGFTWQGASLPTGWKIASNSSNVIKIQTINNGYNVSPGSSVTVTLTLGVIPSLSTDYSSGTLASVQAGYDKKVGGRRTKTINNPPSTFPWAHSLLMTLVPSPLSVPLNGTFNLVMTVTNKSSSTQSGINSSPKPPTPNCLPNPSCVTTSSNPGNIIPLTPGATLSLSPWTYTATKSGTVSFTALASNGTATSTLVTSAVVVINTLSASIAITPNNSCFASGGTATFTMTVTNNTASALTTITPVLNPYTTGTAIIGPLTLVPTSNPCPVSPATLAVNAICSFAWTATVTDPTIPASGSLSGFYATGIASSSSPSVTSPLATSNTVSVVGFAVNPLAPSATNASSTNAELGWVVANRGCTAIQSVSVSIPTGAGWTASTESYAIINPASLSFDDAHWTGTLSNPVMVFSPSSTTYNIGVGSNAQFDIVFSATPPTAGSSVFNVTMVDQNGVTQSPQPTTITVNPYDNSTPGAGNYSTQKFWRESFQ